MGIYREEMNPQILVDNLEQPRLNELIDPTILAISDNARETGMNLLNNAHNSMIDNFRLIKWLFHELEEVRNRVSQMENIKKKIGAESQEDQDRWESLMERRIKNLENYNHNLENQMISLLGSINDNILSLLGNLKDRNLLVEEDGQNRDKARSDEDKATDSTFTTLEQDLVNVQDHKAEEQQKFAKAAQTMHEMENKTEGQVSYLLSFCFLGFWLFVKFLFKTGWFPGLLVGSCFGLRLWAYYQPQELCFGQALFAYYQPCYCKTYGFQDLLKPVFLIKNKYFSQQIPLPPSIFKYRFFCLQSSQNQSSQDSFEASPTMLWELSLNHINICAVYTPCSYCLDKKIF